ncbi:hypothetical protein HDV05_006457 [Chytridiales sp. JEL 0842]|nr:hypothetical protein HDV05_006457 [Chytridiales sp. JEL 0842]
MDVGYQKGLLGIVEVLLTNVSNEEAFTLLVRLMFTYKLRDFHLNESTTAYDKNSVFLLIRLHRLKQLVEELLPATTAHFKKVSFEPDTIFADWFASLFTCVLPTEFVVRILDLVFLEGVDVQLFRFSVTLLKYLEPRLLEVERREDVEVLVKFWKLPNLEDPFTTALRPQDQGNLVGPAKKSGEEEEGAHLTPPATPKVPPTTHAHTTNSSPSTSPTIVTPTPSHTTYTPVPFPPLPHLLLTSNTLPLPLLSSPLPLSLPTPRDLEFQSLLSSHKNLKTRLSDLEKEYAVLNGEHIGLCKQAQEGKGEYERRLRRLEGLEGQVERLMGMIVGGKEEMGSKSEKVQGGGEKGVEGGAEERGDVESKDTPPPISAQGLVQLEMERLRKKNKDLESMNANLLAVQKTLRDAIERENKRLWECEEAKSELMEKLERLREALRRNSQETEPLLGGSRDEYASKKTTLVSTLITAAKQVLLPIAIAVPTLVLLFHFFPPGPPRPPFPPVGGPPLEFITKDAFEYGLSKCAENEGKVAFNNEAFLTGGGPSGRRMRNPRFSVIQSTSYTKKTTMPVDTTHTDPSEFKPTTGAPILFKHATVWDGVGGKLNDTDVAVAYGLIIKIGKGLSPGDVIAAAVKEGYAEASGATKSYTADDVTVIDVGGRILSPGLVDQHSHLTVDAYPNLWGVSDTNEMSDSIVNPQLFIKDAINVLDPAIEIISSGGVTTSLILPGSGTLMGGEAQPIKLLRPGSFSNEDMTLFRGANEDPVTGANAAPGTKGYDGKKWRYMKMACGENPKRYGQAKGFMPGSRMGSGWMFRKRFEQARTTLRAQEDWCESASKAKKAFKDDAYMHVHKRYPDTLVDESLVALLRGDIRLNVHCYETHDLQMMIRTKNEFGFKVAAFHHASEAHLIAPTLAKENISVAIFADHSLYKKEAYGHSIHAPKILHEAGVKVVFKSDHPVLNAQHLIYEAQKGHHYGLEEAAAFAAVTSIPAERLGVGYRVGSLKVGYDADLVIWDRNPLQVGAHPLEVYIDGFQAFKQPFTPLPHPMPVPAPAISEPENVKHALGTYTVTNVGKVYADAGVVIEKASVVVVDGKVQCIGKEGECAAKGKVIDLKGGVIVPGLIATHVYLGLEEISSEDSTQDGPSKTADAIVGLVHAADGLRVGHSKPLVNAFKAGVLTSISVPKARGMVAGVSVAFSTGADLYEESLVKEHAALHVMLGHMSKEAWAGSVSTQIARLRELLSASEPQGPFRDIAAGKLPLLVGAFDASDISKVLRLKAQFPTVKFILAGATGAWQVAEDIAKAKVPVLLLPHRCVPSIWEMRTCRTPSVRPTAFEILKKAGVDVMISVQTDDQIRSLLWEAAWAHGDSTTGVVSVGDALGSVSWTIAKSFGLEETGAGRIAVGTKANFVGLNGGPFGFEYKIQVLADGGSKQAVVIQKQCMTAADEAIQNKRVRAVEIQGKGNGEAK